MDVKTNDAMTHIYDEPNKQQNCGDKLGSLQLQTDGSSEAADVTKTDEFNTIRLYYSIHYPIIDALINCCPV